MIVTLPYPPSANVYWRTTKFGRTYVSDEAKEYRERVQAIAAKHRLSPIRGGEVQVKVEVYRPRRAGDLDNRLKPLLDSLIGIAYADDGQIADIHARRFDDKDNPRVVVQVLPFDEDSLFE